MLRLTRTAIGLLTAQYRSVLKKCWAINVGIFGLMGKAAASVANGAADTIGGTLNGYGINVMAYMLGLLDSLLNLKSNAFDEQSAKAPATSLPFDAPTVAGTLSAFGVNVMDGILLNLQSKKFVTLKALPAAVVAATVMATTLTAMPTEAEAATGCAALTDSSSLTDVINCLKNSKLALGSTDSAAGDRSTAIGSNNTASGSSSVAIGNSNTATYEATTAVGSSNSAAWTGATAIGFNNQASGHHSTTLGVGNTANATYSMALGVSSQANGESSSAVGRSNTASGLESSAVGYSNTASKNYSSAFGYSNTASGVDSSAFGYSNTASGRNSSAFGYMNTATKDYTTAIGYMNTASWDYSSAFGYMNTASGERSSAFGSSSYAVQNYTTAIGFQAVANEAVPLDSNNKPTQGIISVGHKNGDPRAQTAGGGTYTSDYFSRIINVANGTDAHDAATVGQMNTALNNYYRKEDLRCGQVIDFARYFKTGKFGENARFLCVINDNFATNLTSKIGGFATNHPPRLGAFAKCEKACSRLSERYIAALGKNRAFEDIASTDAGTFLFVSQTRKNVMDSFSQNARFMAVANDNFAITTFLRAI